MVTDSTTSISNETSEVSQIQSVNELKRLTRLRANSWGLYPIEKIKKGFNIRKKVKTDGLVESIQTNGIKQPLILNVSGILIDGYRRYKTAVSVGCTEVPVMVIEIPDEEIPLYQYLTMQREDISESERSLAVHNYVQLNPEIPQSEVVKKFNVSAETVSRVYRVCALEDSILPEAISIGVVTPTTGWNILNQASPENLADIEGLLKDRIEHLPPEVDVKPVSLKGLNSELVKKGKKPVPSTNKLVNEQSRISKECLFSLIKELTAVPQEDGIHVSAIIPKELWEAVNKVIEQSRSIEVKRISVREVEDELALYTEHSANGEVFIQTEDGYVSFNSGLAELGLALTVENSLEKVIVRPDELEKVVKRIKNNNVTIINVTKHNVKPEKRTRKRKGKNTEEDIEEDDNSTEEEIQELLLKSLDKFSANTNLNIEPVTVEAVEILEEKVEKIEEPIAIIETSQDDSENDEFDNLIVGIDGDGTNFLTADDLLDDEIVEDLPF